MAVAVLDTNVLFASASARDEYHAPAQEIVRGIDHGELPEAIVTNYVVAETLNLSGEKLGADAANQMLDRLIEGAHFRDSSRPKSGFQRRTSPLPPAQRTFIRRLDHCGAHDSAGCGVPVLV